MIKKIIIKIFSSIINRLSENIRIPIKFNRRETGVLDFKESPIKLVISSTLSFLRLNSCKKEPDTINWLKDEVRSKDVFFDIGANTGSYSLVAAALLDGDIKVFSFEPVPGTFAELCENINLNNFSGVIFPINVPLSNENAVVEFKLRDLRPGAAMHKGISQVDLLTNDHNSIFGFNLYVKKLDSIIEDFNLPTPSLIKIDVDGPELEILKGAHKTLSEKNLRSIQIEIDNTSEEAIEICNLLKNYGFCIHKKNRHRNSEIFDYVFKRTI